MPAAITVETTVRREGVLSGRSDCRTDDGAHAATSSSPCSPASEMLVRRGADLAGRPGFVKEHGGVSLGALPVAVSFHAGPTGRLIPA